MSSFEVLPLLLSLLSTWRIFSDAHCHAHDGLLYPIAGDTRETLWLDGTWKLRFAKPFDPDEGFRDSWYSRPLDQDASVFRVPVPSNYPTTFSNPEYFYSTDGKKTVSTFYPGWVWYERDFTLPLEWKEKGRRIFLRVGAAHYNSIVYVNGQKVAEHEGGSIPFAAELTTTLSPAQLYFEPAKNRLTIATNSSLSSETIPQGRVVVTNWDNRPRLEQHGVNQNYWKYGGIHGSVILYTTPKTFVEDINVTTGYEGGVGYVNYSVRALRHVSLNASTVNATQFTCCGPYTFRGCHFNVQLLDNNGQVVASSEGPPVGVLAIQKPNLWWPYTMAPDDKVGYLYTLQIRLTDEDTLEQDVYKLDVGIRTVAWTENKLYVNGRTFDLRGILRGLCQKVLDDDHYEFRILLWKFWPTPCAGFTTRFTEDTMRAADRQGFVVISEVPAVDLKFFGQHLLDLHKKILRQLVQRDKSSPSVLIFSLANLIHDDDLGAGMALESGNYFRSLTRYGRELDPQDRPLAVTVKAQNLRSSSAVEHVDIVGLSWHKNAVVGQNLVELNQTVITEDIIEWTAQQRRGRRKPLLFVAEYGVYPTQLYSEACSLISPYERDVLDEFHAIFDQLESNVEVGLIGEINWTCDSGRFSITSHTNDKYFCRTIRERFAKKTTVQKT